MEILTIIIALIITIIAFWVGLKIGELKKDSYWEGQIDKERKDAIERSRSVLTGHFSEQLAPYFPDFNYSPTECKFIGKPIDFIVFKGLDEKKVEEIVFVEVKSGKSKMTSKEKSVKEAIHKKKVKFEEYRVPDKN